MESHLLQMRGLKLPLVLAIISVFLVASFTDAWIETALTAPQQGIAPRRIFYRCVD